MSQISTLELFKERMKFSVAHFTIFSATEREPLHGHNYTAYLSLTNRVEDNGLSFDYRYYKKKIYELCDYLNQSVLLPLESKYLTFERDEKYLYAVFNQDRIPFIEKETTLLPVCNITVEELSRWFIEELTKDKIELKKHKIEAMTVKIFSGPGQSGSAHWEKKDV